jgi:rhamnopyranosyl-N-acetylglucosaminyl-diphospho-decaprenol beta-1,3/1,4-galactofuranosyltransferase
VRIIAIVVTHNRRDLLARCVSALQSQTRPADKVLVINNDSRDGTVEMLQHRGIEFVSQPNVGSAGGWYKGIEIAMSEGFDAVWLMDDDGFADTAALAALERALVPGVACASSVVLRENQPTHFVFAFPVLDEHGLPVIFGRPRKLATLANLRRLSGGDTYPFAHFFNGALLSVEAARSVGNVDREFFIFGDEVDYFFRLRKAGSVVSVLDAAHFHPDVSQRPYTPAKIHYYIKNTLILNKRYFNAVWLRHCMTIAVALGRTWRRNSTMAVFSLLAGRDAPAFYSAIANGLRGKVGRDFNG